MRPVSDRFLESLRGSHTASVQAFIVAAGQTGTSPTGTEVTVLAGDVELDAKADIRSTLDITIDGTGLFPDNSDDLVTPYGNEVFIRRGIVFGGGSVEWVSLGYFRINSIEQDDAPNGPIRLGCQDRMSGIVDGRMLAPTQFLSTVSYGDLVEDLVEEIYPWATIQWDDLSYTDAIGRSLIVEEDRFAFLNELVVSLGKIWYWDHRGILVIKDAPSSDDPVWEVNSGANGVLRTMSRDLSREGVYNAVAASGEALDTDTPSRGVAIDNNPDSPTYYYGDFGKVPRYYSSPFITTDAQAITAAESILRQNLGLPYNVNFSLAAANAALEPWDPVTIKLNSKTETHIIERLTIPLAVENVMTADTREQTLVVIGSA